MPDISNLKPGESYIVIKEFTNYDGNLHKVGERWIFEEINYLPYHSGLSLNVIENGKSVTYRFQDEPDQQQKLLECFMDYVAEQKLSFVIIDGYFVFDKTPFAEANQNKFIVKVQFSK